MLSTAGFYYGKANCTFLFDASLIDDTSVMESWKLTRYYCS